MKFKRAVKLVALSTVITLGFSSCKKKKKSDSSDDSSSVITDAFSGPGTPTETSALAITGLNFLAADSGSTSLNLGKLFLAGTDYDNDLQNKEVYDPALDSLSSAGSIICFFNQTNYIEMESVGQYAAQVDMNACFGKGGGSSDGNSSGNQKEMVNMVVETVRASTTSPLIVKAWFDMAQGEGRNTRMNIKMTVSEGTSATNPLGIFALSWKGIALDGNMAPTATVAMKGMVAVTRSANDGKINLAFIDNSSEGNNYQNVYAKAELTIAAETISGGLVRTLKETSWDGHSENGEYIASFDASYFLRKKVGEDAQCLNRNSFDSSVWRYGLYNVADGSRVTRNGGFPIKIARSNGTYAHGWASYWGVWAPGDISLSSGTTVTRQYQDNTTKDYTVVASTGKLIKHTKLTLTAAELVGIPLNKWSQSGEYQIEWNGTNFVKKAKMTQSGNRYWDSSCSDCGQVYTPDVGSGSENAFNEFHSEALGGRVTIMINSAGAIASIIYYKEENVTASEASKSLYCYVGCLKANITQTQANNGVIMGENNSSADAASYAPSSTAKTYAWDLTTMGLKYDNSPVALASGVSSIDGQNSWGFHSGPLVTSNSLTNKWDVFNQAVFYTWETGPNNWNKYTGLKDSTGAFATFDAPLFFTYTHSKENDASGQESSSFYGKKFQIQFEGHGNLHGIPENSNADGSRWHPAFALKDGTLLGDANQYKVKALDMEQRMRVDASGCAGLSVDTAPTLPALTTWVDPELEAMPTIDSAPKVVEGETLSQ